MIKSSLPENASPDAALFDMDGLLIDTERLSLETFAQTCELHAAGDQRALFMSLVGCNELSLMALLREGIGDRVDVVGFRRDWEKRYHARITDGEIDLKPGVLELLEWLSGNQVKMAVATSSVTSVAAMKLTRTGIFESFQVIVGGDMVENSKPDPEIFLKAAKAIDADLSRTLVFEDSTNGVKAGVAAGLTVFQVPDLMEPAAELLQLGHHVCSSLHDVLAILQSGRYQFNNLDYL